MNHRSTRIEPAGRDDRSGSVRGDEVPSARDLRRRLYNAWGVNLSADRSAIMGIVNITPDSFYDGGRYADTETAVARGIALAEEGASLLDVGGESTRPGSEEVPASEEIRRVVPVIRALNERLDIPVSIDTRKADVAAAAVEAGASVINDVSGLTHDPHLAGVAAATGAGLVISHTRGTPKEMQSMADYADVTAEVRDELAGAATRAVAAGVSREKIVLDPGIGFGKTTTHNLRLLGHLFELRSTGFPILLGPSRKSFIGAILDLPAEERLEGTIAACVLAVRSGADIFRVNDVRSVLRAVRVAEAIESGEA